MSYRLKTPRFSSLSFPFLRTTVIIAQTLILTVIASRVAANSEENKMESSSLATVIAPNALYRQVTLPASIAEDTEAANWVLDMLIFHHKDVFAGVAKQMVRSYPPLLGETINFQAGRPRIYAPTFIVANFELISPFNTNSDAFSAQIRLDTLDCTIDVEHRSDTYDRRE